ncbi:MAG: GFA family protein [Candidatus Obscuribacterales bacterium]|nr:GFA family protein [Steroidobacteraceae bacterium]
MLTGQCYCGFVRYTVGGVPCNETNCHCSICRRTSGAPFVAWFSIPVSTFNIIAGELRRFSSSDHGERTFCPRCGTPLTFRSSRSPHELDVTTCSLANPEQVAPKDHTRTSSKLSWVKLADGLPCFPEARSY